MLEQPLLLLRTYRWFVPYPNRGKRNKQPASVIWTIVTRRYQKRWNLFERSMFLLTIFACTGLYYICRIGRINFGDDEGKSKAKIWMINGDDEEILMKPLRVDFTKLSTRTVTCLFLGKVYFATVTKYLQFNFAAKSNIWQREWRLKVNFRTSINLKDMRTWRGTHVRENYEKSYFCTTLH